MQKHNINTDSHQQKSSQPRDVSAFRDEVRWLKSEDKDLFNYLEKSINKIEPAYVATYPPSECGIATFTRDLLSAVAYYTPFSKPTVIAVKKDHEIEPFNRIVRCNLLKSDRQSYVRAAEFLNRSTADIISIQHEYGIYGGTDGEYILDLLSHLKKPAIATLHTVLQKPSPNQKQIIKEMGDMCEKLIVMVETGRRILCDVYGINPAKIAVIAHGVPNVHKTIPDTIKKALGISDKQIISTFGLINRGKGLEHVIEAMPYILEKHPNAVYLILGQTHPHVRTNEGESYRNMLTQTAKKLGIEENVRFNNRFLTITELVRYLCATDVYVTPYLNKDQIVSGTLAYALGCGKAIVSTPYLYAEEVLSNGRGILTDFSSPKGIAKAVNNILDDSELRASLEANAYTYGRRAAWFNVAIDYLDLCHKILHSKNSVATLPKK